MSALVLVAAATVSVLPCEYHIDCSSWSGQGTAEVDVRIIARDGSRVSFTMEVLPGSTASTARNLIWFQLKGAGWNARAVDPGILIVESAKQSPIRSVEFSGKDWKPTVRWAPVLPIQRK